MQVFGTHVFAAQVLQELEVLVELELVQTGTSASKLFFSFSKAFLYLVSESF